MKNQKRSIPGLMLVLVALIGLSSCNRGYGCPYDFSIADTMSTILVAVVKVIALIF